MTDKVFAQILAVCYSGRANMLDINAVQQIAYESGYYESVCYLERHRRFIS